MSATARFREFEFTDKDFQCLRQLAREITGISLADCKRELIYSRLSRRLRHLGLRSFAHYRDLLSSTEGHGELREFTVGPSAEESLNDALASPKLPLYLVDIRSASDDPAAGA